MARLRLVIDFPDSVADGIRRYSADDKGEFYKAFVIDCVKQIVSNRDGKLRRRNGGQKEGEEEILG